MSCYSRHVGWIVVILGWTIAQPLVSGFVFLWAQPRPFRYETFTSNVLFIVNQGAATRRWQARPRNPLQQLASSANGNSDPLSQDAIDLFLARAEALWDRGEHLVFSISARKTAKKKAGERGTLRSIEGRPVQLSMGRIVTQVTFKYHGSTDIVKNWDRSDSTANLAMILRYGQASNLIPKTEWDNTPPNMTLQWIQSAEIEAHDKIYRIRWSPRSTSFHIDTTTKPFHNNTSNNAIQPHDREKQSVLRPDHPVWEALGIANKEQKIKPNMAAKYRQCQKFLEIVSRLVPSSSKNAPQRRISVVDMGCGRGYLTFALHAYLTESHRHVTTKGIDIRPKLVADMNTIAKTLAMDGLSFECGTIDSFLLQDQRTDHDHRNDELSILIALHACDTATDDALWSGILHKADALVVVPCCHKQVRPQLDKLVSAKPDRHPYADIFQHGIYRERMAETVTDSIRGLILELCGYKVQVFEFIGGEHTTKNVMITAVKKQVHPNEDQKSDLRIRIQALAELHGITHQSLAARIELPLCIGGESASQLGMNRSINLYGMPSLFP